VCERESVCVRERWIERERAAKTGCFPRIYRLLQILQPEREREKARERERQQERKRKRERERERERVCVREREVQRQDVLQEST